MSSNIALDEVVGSDSSNLPLTPQQEALWWSELFADEQISNAIPLCAKMSGRIDLARFHQVVIDEWLSHDALRLCFDVDSAGTPFQRVSSLKPNLSVNRIASFNDSDALDFARDEAARHWDQVGLPMRLSIFLDNAGNVYLTGAVRHLVFDGWSYGLMIDGITSRYNSCSRPGSSFADHVAAELALDKSYKNELSFWKQYLGTSVADVDNSWPKYNNVSRTTVLDRNETTNAFRISRHLTGGSEIPLLIMGLASALMETFNDSEIVVGVPFHHRTATSSRIVGCFADLIPLKILENYGLIEVARDLRAAISNALPTALISEEASVRGRLGLPLVIGARLPAIGRFFDGATIKPLRRPSSKVREIAVIEAVHGEHGPHVDIELDTVQLDETLRSRILYRARNVLQLDF